MTFASWKKINHSTMQASRSVRFCSFFVFSLTLLFASCAANPLGQKMKEPFSGSKYESTNRYYRATGKGTSKMDAVATSQAEMRARQNLAQQVQTYFEVVSDDYQKSTTGQVLDEAMTRFETLAREITSTKLADMRQIGNEKYRGEDGGYTVYVAIEIKKASMYRQLKKQARLDSRIKASELDAINALLDQLIEQADSAE
jgi:hypothetical protein